MQSFSSAADRILGGNLALTVGLLLVGLLALRLVIWCASVLQGLYYSGRRERLELKRLRNQLELLERQTRDAEQKSFAWNGYRKFKVARKVSECEGVCSFYLEPHDRKPLPTYLPGQFLTFQLQVPGQSKPVVRCYSLSDCASEAIHYRVTIKKVVKPDTSCGIASAYFCDQVKEGDLLDVKAPSGKFTLDPSGAAPVVLISGGVGLTPMLSMVNAIIRLNKKREVWFFYGARNGSEHIQRQYLTRLADEHRNVRMQICYSRPAPEERAGRDFQHAERISIELLKKVLPTNQYEYYICGPPEMMKAVPEGLMEWGVPRENIFTESFGPATIKAAVVPATTAPSNEPAVKITFAKSQKAVAWDSGAATLWDLADRHGITIPKGCGCGDCGSCEVAIRSGSIEHVKTPTAAVADGSCLSCICRPKTDLVVDA